MDLLTTPSQYLAIENTESYIFLFITMILVMEHKTVQQNYLE